MKMRKYIEVWLCGAVLLLASCCATTDDFAVLKQYQPDEPYFTATLKSLHFLIETADIARIDTVFRTFINDLHLPTSAQGGKDGLYTGKSPYDAFDYQHVVTLQIRAEKIIAVDYDEVNKEGQGKQRDGKYNQEMSVTGTTPSKAYPIYENALLEKQDIMEVDAVSGASYSHFRFRYAVVMALMKARL